MENFLKAGFSLIEVMVAFLILAIMVVAGAAVLYQTGGGIQVAGNKRVALERARTHLETLRSQDYFVLRADAVAGNPGVVSFNETLNSVTIAITTTNLLVSSGGILDTVSGGTLDNEYLKLSVLAVYGDADEHVLLHANKVISP